MSLHYGNWCGPGWTAGQKKDAKQLTNEDFNVPAINGLDQACKTHDIGLYYAKTKSDIERVNRRFIKEAYNYGITGKAMGWLVNKFGPKNPDTDTIEAISKQFKPLLEGPKQVKRPSDTPNERNVKQKTTPTMRIEKTYSTPDTEEKPLKKWSKKKQRRFTKITKQLSFNNLLPSPNMSGSGTNTSNNAGQETNVDDVGEQKLNPFHQTQDVILPAYIAVNQTIAADKNSVVWFTIRLNSPYDWLTAFTTTADTDPFDQVLDVGIRQTPLNYTYWSSIYQYITCTSVEYEVTFFTDSLFTSQMQELSVYCYHHGHQGPPITDAGVKIPDYIRRQHKHMQMQKLNRRRQDELAYDTNITFTGKWEPGNYYVQNLVSEDSQKRTWNKFNQLPPLHEMATFILQHSDRSFDLPQIWSVYGEVKVIYHCQCKDLKYKFEYPLQSTDIPLITDFGSLDKQP